MRRVALILLIVLLAGCVEPIDPEPPTPPQNQTVPTASANTAIEGSKYLPVGFSGQSYQAAFTPVGGVQPYACKLVGSGSIAGNNLFMARDCSIVGSAPVVTENTIYPFNVVVTEANGEWITLSPTLTVEMAPIKFDLPDTLDPPAVKGKTYLYDFCDPKNQAQCGNSIVQKNPINGRPPYTFTVSGQPMGFVMSLNGVLAGTVSEHANWESYNLEVCIKDTVGTQACDRTILPVIDEESDIIDDEDEEEEKPVKTEWLVRGYGDGSYDEQAYGISYEYDGEFSINVAENTLIEGEVVGGGTGWVQIVQTDGVCMGSDWQEVTFSISGTIFEGNADILMYGTDPSTFLLTVECDGYTMISEIDSPYDFDTKFVTVNLTPGTETTETISIPGEHARTNDWTFTVLS